MNMSKFKINELKRIYSDVLSRRILEEAKTGRIYSICTFDFVLEYVYKNLNLFLEDLVTGVESALRDADRGKEIRYGRLSYYTDRDKTTPVPEEFKTLYIDTIWGGLKSGSVKITPDYGSLKILDSLITWSKETNYYPYSNKEFKYLSDYKSKLRNHLLAKGRASLDNPIGGPAKCEKVYYNK